MYNILIYQYIKVSTITTTPGRAVAARGAHNPEVVGSNPTPATKNNDFLYK